MPRVSRENSKTITKTYHIMLRGINKQDIFLDNQDRSKFLKELRLSKEKFRYEIYAYVLMNNHVHLAICDENDKLSDIIHKLGTSYAMYFNKKYKRVGHVFQNRFKSICVDTEEYLKSLVRYIHRNPINDGLCKKYDYNWSSYKEYLYKEELTDTNFLLDIFNKDRREAIKQFVKFNNMDEAKYPDIEFEFEEKMKDEEAAEYIVRFFKIDNLFEIQKYNLKIRNEYICKISKMKGITMKQIARLLGMSESMIRKIIRDSKK